MPSSNLFPAPATPDGLQRITGSCGETDDVWLANGDHTKQVALISIPTVGFPLSFILTYHSQESVNFSLGPKWRHNYMRYLSLENYPLTNIVYTDDVGSVYSFSLIDSVWTLDSYSYFLDAVLTQNMDGTFSLTFPDESFYSFDTGGTLTALTDAYGNATTLNYPSGNMVVTEPTGRSLSVSHSASWYSSITDPNGNEWQFLHDEDNGNLVDIVGPSGCILHYDYQNPYDPSVITRRVDANGHTMLYTLDSSQRLTEVQDSEGNSVTYIYNTVLEYVSDSPFTTQSFPRATVVDALDNEWQYHFDNASQMWRVTQPNGHDRHYYHDYNQNLLFQSAGFPFYNTAGPTANAPRDCTNDTYQRFAYDNANSTSNSTLLYHADATGMLTQYTYNSARRVTSQYPGRGHLGVQGNWIGQFGSDGYLLCAFNDDASDLSSLPPYVSSISQGTSSNSHMDQDTYFANLLDPRAAVAPTNLNRSVGFWQSSISFTLTVTPSEAQAFNLTLYTCQADFPPEFTSTFLYCEQFGSDLMFTVTDMNGTQNCRVTNNASGTWLTFPVQGDATHTITVTVAPMGLNTNWAGISAIAFDPIDDHGLYYTYNSQGDVLTVTDGLGNETVFTYNTDGTLATATDARGNETQFFYTDTSKNLTQIKDAALNSSYLTYDLNGNILSYQDANGYTWTATYDSNNRLLTVTDPLGDLVVQRTYDSVGNLLSSEDANTHVTRFQCEPSAAVLEPACYPIEGPSAHV